MEGRFNGGVFALPVWGGLYLEGLIFGILRYPYATSYFFGLNLLQAKYLFYFLNESLRKRKIESRFGPYVLEKNRVSFWAPRFSLTCLVSETSHRDRWKRDSISRFRLDWRIRNREALKSRRFLSSNLRHVAQKR